MAKLLIFGNSIMAKLAYFYFANDSAHEVVAFTVDQEYITADHFLDLPVIPFHDLVTTFPPTTHKLFIAMGYQKMNKPRASKYFQAKELGYELVSYISSKSIFLSQFPPGDNCFILEGTIIQPYARIGNNVFLWSGTQICHDSVVEDHCFLASHVVVSGNTHISPYCFIGMNASIRNGITLAPETLIGAGALLMENTIEKSVYLPQKTIPIPKPSDEIEL